MRIKFLPLLGMSSFSLFLNATDGTWTTNGNGDWFTPTNWSTNPTVPNAAGDIARFSSPAVTAPNVAIGLSASPTIGQLFIDGASNYTIGPANGLILSNIAAQFLTIEIDNTNGNGRHTISGNVTLSPAAFPSLVEINQNSTSPFTISGVISQTVPSPMGTVRYNGPGVMVLSGNNTFLNLDIFGGTVSVSSEANLGATTNVLVIENDATLLTTADFTMSRNIFIINDATIKTQSGTTLKHTGFITEVFGGTLHKDGGGVLEIDGTANIMGMTEVVNGDLRIIGTYSNTGAGGILVDSGGTLSGTSVGSDLFHTSVTNNGTVSPGTPSIPGTMTVKGSYTQSPSGNLSINFINPTSFSVLSISGNPATADITGGSLKILFDPNAEIVINKNFTVLNALASVTGTFTNVAANTPLLLVTPVYAPTSVSVFFTLAPATELGPVTQSRQAANAATLASTNQSVGQASVRLSELQEKTQSYREGFKCAAAPQNSRTKYGEIYELEMVASAPPRADIMLVDDRPLLAQTDQQARRKEQQVRMRIPPAITELPPGRVYIGPTGGFGRASHTGYWDVGAQAGFDYAFPQFGLGLLFEYQHTEGKGFEVDGTKLTLYSSYVPRQLPQLSIGTIIGGGYDWFSFSSHRETLAGTKTVRGSPEGTEFNATLDLQYTLNNSQFPRMAENFQITPVINLEYIQNHVNGFREHGADLFDLEIGEQTLKFLFITLEARVSYVQEWENIMLIPMVYAGWQRNLLDQDNKFKFRFAITEDEFTKVNLKKFGRNNALAGMDLALYFYKKYGIEASYDFQWNSLYYDNKFYLGFNYLF